MRNRFPGLVTRVVRDTVMAQVEIQAGPHRFVSLVSREAADELGLEPGMLAVAAVKATSISVESHRASGDSKRASLACVVSITLVQPCSSSAGVISTAAMSLTAALGQEVSGP